MSVLKKAGYFTARLESGMNSSFRRHSSFVTGHIQLHYAALVKQAAAAAESLEEQAQNLAVTVSVFKEGNHSGSSYRLIPHSTAPATQHKAQLATVNAGGWEEF